MKVTRDEIVEGLRGRDEHDLAEQAEVELPEEVDTDDDAEMLHRLGINPADLLGGIGGTFG
jgi:hypothetical protein